MLGEIFCVGYFVKFLVFVGEGRGVVFFFLVFLVGWEILNLLVDLVVLLFIWYWGSCGMDFDLVVFLLCLDFDFECLRFVNNFFFLFEFVFMSRKL